MSNYAVAEEARVHQTWPQVATSDTHFWYVSEERVEDERVLAVLHRHISDPPGVLRRTLKIQSESTTLPEPKPILMQRIAASKNRLILIADDYRIWSITVSPNDVPNGPRWVYTRSTLPAIPGLSALDQDAKQPQVESIQLTATDSGDWLFIRGRLNTDAIMPEAVRQLSDEDETFWIVVMDMPGVLESISDEASSTDSESKQPANDEASTPSSDELVTEEEATSDVKTKTTVEEGVFLFKRKGADWQHMPLPDPITQAKRQILPATAGQNLVVVQVSDIPRDELKMLLDGALPGLGRVEVWRFDDSVWNMLSTGLDMSSKQITNATMIHQQAVLGRNIGDHARQLFLLRQTQGVTERLKLHDVGVLRVEELENDTVNSNLVTYSDAITLLSIRSLTGLAPGESSQPVVLGQATTLSGDKTTLEPMFAKPAEREQISANQWIEVGALIIAITLMMLFWMREVKRAPEALPDGLKPAALTSRTLAGFIDLLPAVAIIGLVFRFDPQMYTDPWSANAGGSNLEQMMRWLLLIALFVLYTWISELTTQTTMGKRLFKLKVVRLDGSRPSFVALSLRNLLRTLDLMVPVLLLLPLLWPKRQRLGDLVAQTIVVENADGESNEKANHDG